MVPNPLTAFACGTAGALGMALRRFLVASLVGRVALGLLLAYLGNGVVRWLAPGLLS